MRKFHFAAAFFAACTGAAALALPAVNGAKITTRIFNDFTDSGFSSTNFYPASLTMHDQVGSDADGFANRHVFHLSDDGGANDAVFLNGDSFAFYSDVSITGPGEVGLHIAPWWFPGDGQFMLNGNSGEIAIFGGRMPFYSFSAHGFNYVNGATYTLGVIYNAHSNSALDPATIQYVLGIGGSNHYSPIIPFDQGNPAEDPPHGQYGLLNPFYPGGYYQANLGAGPSTAVFSNMRFVPEPASALLLGLAAFALRRR